MHGRQVLSLGLAGILSLGSYAPAAKSLHNFTQNENTASQSFPSPRYDYGEIKQLARSVVSHVYAAPIGLTINNGRIDSHSALDFADLTDMATGKHVAKAEYTGESTAEFLRSWYGQNANKPAEFREDILPQPFRSDRYYFGYFGTHSDTLGEIEIKVYYDDGQKLNWSNPNNYLRFSWFGEQQRWSRFTDKEIDGIVNESFTLEPDKQKAYANHLRKIENLFVEK